MKFHVSEFIAVDFCWGFIYWSLVSRHWSLVTGYSMLVTCHLLLVFGGCSELHDVGYTVKVRPIRNLKSEIEYLCILVV